MQGYLDTYRDAFLFVDTAAPGWRVLHLNQAAVDKLGARPRKAWPPGAWCRAARSRTGSWSAAWARAQEWKWRRSAATRSGTCSARTRTPRAAGCAPARRAARRDGRPRTAPAHAPGVASK